MYIYILDIYSIYRFPMDINPPHPTVGAGETSLLLDWSTHTHWGGEGGRGQAGLHHIYFPNRWYKHRFNSTQSDTNHKIICFGWKNEQKRRCCASPLFFLLFAGLDAGTCCCNNTVSDGHLTKYFVTQPWKDLAALAPRELLRFSSPE